MNVATYHVAPVLSGWRSAMFALALLSVTTAFTCSADEKADTNTKCSTSRDINATDNIASAISMLKTRSKPKGYLYSGSEYLIRGDCISYLFLLAYSVTSKQKLHLTNNQFIDIISLLDERDSYLNVVLFLILSKSEINLSTRACYLKNIYELSRFYFASRFSTYKTLKEYYGDKNYGNAYRGLLFMSDVIEGLNKEHRIECVIVK